MLEDVTQVLTLRPSSVLPVLSCFLPSPATSQSTIFRLHWIGIVLLEFTCQFGQTKIVVFNQSGRVGRQHHFYYKNSLVDMTSSYCYLGIIFSCCWSFTKAIDRLIKDQALKALFKLKQKDLQNHPATALKLFETLILPIIRYCAEVWTPFSVKNLSDQTLYQTCDKLPMEIVHKILQIFIRS